MDEITHIDNETGIVIHDEMCCPKSFSQPKRSRINSFEMYTSALKNGEQILLNKSITCRRDNLRREGLQRKGLCPKNRNRTKKFDLTDGDRTKTNEKNESFNNLEKNKATKLYPNIFIDDKNNINTSRKNIVSHNRKDTTISHTDVQDILDSMLSESCKSHERLFLCKTLSSLAVTEDVKCEVVLSGGILAVFKMMGRELASDKELQEISCELFNTLLPHTKDEFLEDIPIVEVMIDLMIYHSSSVRIMESCMGILRNLSYRCSHYHYIADNGALDLVISIVEIQQSRKLQEDGSAILKKYFPK